MIYTELTNKAMKIAYEKHHGQKDKSGVPYIFHPFHLAEQMGDDEYAVCTALLHDIVEDTDMTFNDLEREGFPEEIIEAVRCLTHEDSVPYLGAYIEGIKANPLARKVKLADLAHNMDPTRLPPAESESEILKRTQREEKYRKAKSFLETA